MKEEGIFSLNTSSSGFPDNLKIIHPWDRLKERKQRKQHDYIIGGEESPRNLYPGSVFLLIFKNGGGFACGGTLITRWFVLKLLIVVVKYFVFEQAYSLCFTLYLQQETKSYPTWQCQGSPWRS